MSLRGKHLQMEGAKTRMKMDFSYLNGTKHQRGFAFAFAFYQYEQALIVRQGRQCTAHLAGLVSDPSQFSPFIPGTPEEIFSPWIKFQRKTRWKYFKMVSLFTLFCLHRVSGGFFSNGTLYK